MFDINSRMEQWSAANRAQHTEEIAKALQTPPQPAPTEQMTKSASIADRAKPFRKSVSPEFDIDKRINAWNGTEKAGDRLTHDVLSATNPFKRAEEMTQVVEQLMQEPPEALIELAEELIDELESREAGEPSEGTPEETPVEKEESTAKEEKADEPKESDDKEDDKDKNPFE